VANSARLRDVAIDFSTLAVPAGGLPLVQAEALDATLTSVLRALPQVRTAVQVLGPVLAEPAVGVLPVCCFWGLCACASAVRSACCLL
jgi:hypothetical protein